MRGSDLYKEVTSLLEATMLGSALSRGSGGGLPLTRGSDLYTDLR